MMNTSRNPIRGRTWRRKFLPLLYRSAGLLVAGLLAAAPATAQLRRKAPPKGPRALAVLEMQTAPDGKQAIRLVPLAIWDGGKLFDAASYRPRPVPMALDSGVVYEAMRGGASAGLFTVNSARKQGNDWYAIGRWQPAQAEAAVPESKAATGSVTVPGAAGDDADPERPRLKRGGQDSSGQSGSTGSGNPGDYNAGDLPPQGDRSGRDGGEPEMNAEDPERPTLKRRPPGEGGELNTANPPEASIPSTPLPGDDDPDRPVLKRGRPTGQDANQNEDSQAEAAPNSPPQTAAGAAGPSAAAPLNLDRVPAISDAENTETRSFDFRWTADEQQRLTQAMRALAIQQVVAAIPTAKAVPPAKPAAGQARTTRPPAAPQVTLSAVNVRAFDLDTDNYAELILTARFTAPGNRQGQITVVGRTDLDGKPRLLLRNVSEDGRQDITPRLELVDAVDGDGDGRAELLFRRSDSAEAHYALYRVGRTVELLLEGSAAAR